MATISAIPDAAQQHIEELESHNLLLRGALRTIRDHWRECGPERGFGEMLEEMLESLTALGLGEETPGGSPVTCRTGGWPGLDVEVAAVHRDALGAIRALTRVQHCFLCAAPDGAEHAEGCPYQEEVPTEPALPKLLPWPILCPRCDNLLARTDGRILHIDGEEWPVASPRPIGIRCPCGASKEWEPTS